MMLTALGETFRSALGAMGTHKLRSGLTLLGIVIGVLAVVAMAATVEGLRRRIHGDLAQLGTGVFQVQKQPLGFGGGRRRHEIEKRKDFTLADIRLLKTSCASCLRVGGEVWENLPGISAGDKRIAGAVAVVGATSEFFDNNGYALASGRLFEEGEALGNADVAVVGSDVVDVLFPNETIDGQVIRIGRRTVRLIGTLRRRGSNLGGSIDNIVVVPIGTFLPLLGAHRSLHVTIQARNPERIAYTQDEVIAILRRARAVPPGAENDFEVFSNASVQDAFEEIAGSIAAATIGVCAIALLIGGIGVMNIMLVTVTERTSEIGLRRALGARRRRILAQFLMEAIVLCAVGGGLGIVLGAAVAQIVRIVVDIPTIVPAWAVVLSLASASSVGLVFGIYPAVRAARLDPVEAMRREG